MGYEHVIPQLFDRARKGQNPLVVYSPAHRRAFCYISDAISAVIACMRNQNADGETFNIGNSAEEYSIEELSLLMIKKMKLNATIECREAANDPIARRSPDISKAFRFLAYKPLVRLDTGLELTLNWYRKGK
jgi:nucleoside-diphosphate-sugar epimerase